MSRLVPSFPPCWKVVKEQHKVDEMKGVEDVFVVVAVVEWQIVSVEDGFTINEE